MVDNEAPFVLVCDDLSPAYPDGWWSPHSHNDAEHFARISNPQGLDKRTEILNLDFKIFSFTEKLKRERVWKISHSSTSCIRISLRFFSRVDLISNQINTCSFKASLLSSKVRDGGLIIFDLKTGSMEKIFSKA